MTSRAVVWFRRGPSVGRQTGLGRSEPGAPIESPPSSCSIRASSLLPVGRDATNSGPTCTGWTRACDRGGGRLHVLRGDPVVAVPQTSRACGAAAVYANADVSQIVCRRRSRPAQRGPGGFD